MSHDLNKHYISGEPNTTGREPFEDDSTGGGAATGVLGGSNAGVAPTSVGQGHGHEHGHSHGHGHGHSHGHGHEQQKFDASGASAGTQYGQQGTVGSGAPSALSGAGAGAGAGAGVGAGAAEYSNIAPQSHHAHTHGTGLTSGTGSGESRTGAGTGNSATLDQHGVSGTSTAAGTGIGRTGAYDSVGGENANTTREGLGGLGSAQAGSHVDRVGAQGQDSHAYERTGAGGPATSGAAGTDRFDTGSRGAEHGSAQGQDTSQRAPGKESGGIAGILGTSDKDFTGRDRVGGTGGAYADTHGTFQGNETGPKGASALTGREGTLENNPVAQAQSRQQGGSADGTHTSASSGATKEKDDRGIIDKVKDAFKS